MNQHFVFVNGKIVLFCGGGTSSTKIRELEFQPE